MQLSFCSNHSPPANHLHSPKCSLCINNEDECPALYSHKEKEMCFNCIYGSYLKFKKSSHLSKIHLKFVDCLALKMCAKNLVHFIGLSMSKYLRRNFYLSSVATSLIFSLTIVKHLVKIPPAWIYCVS